MQMAKKVCVLPLLQKGDSVIAVARNIGVSREAFFLIKEERGGHFRKSVRKSANCGLKFLFADLRT